MKDDYDYELTTRPTAREQRWYAMQKWWRTTLRRMRVLPAVDLSCPRCGGERIRKIRYGLRRPSLDPKEEAAFHKKYYDAGCVVEKNTHHCDDCRLNYVGPQS